MFFCQHRDRIDIVLLRNAARRDHAAAHGHKHRFLCREVRSRQHTVRANIGVDQSFHTERIHAFRKAQRACASCVDPAFDRDLAILGIDSHGDPVAKGFHQIGDERFTLRCARSDNDASRSDPQRSFHRKTRP